jgi:mono/diheme cytochrome c family protein
MKLLLTLALLAGHNVWSAKETITFTKDVQSIHKSHCLRCHGTSGALPDVTDYETAFELRYDIKKKVQTRQMPYFGDMKESERDIIIKWINEGAKE